MKLRRGKTSNGTPYSSALHPSSHTSIWLDPHSSLSHTSPRSTPPPPRFLFYAPGCEQTAVEDARDGTSHGTECFLSYHGYTEKQTLARRGTRTQSKHGPSKPLDWGLSLWETTSMALCDWRMAVPFLSSESLQIPFSVPAPMAQGLPFPSHLKLYGGDKVEIR